MNEILGVERLAVGTNGWFGIIEMSDNPDNFRDTEVYNLKEIIQLGVEQKRKQDKGD